MKRHGWLWEEMTSYANLLAAARDACRGKRRRENVARFHFHLENELCRLQDELRAGTYRPGTYQVFHITDPVPRRISAAPYRDRVVHHAFYRVVGPIWERAFVADSYACRVGKGTHAAVDRFTKYARDQRYVLKCDVRKYFPSMDHQLLLGLLACKLKDESVLALARLILEHSPPQDDLRILFPNDDLFQNDRRRGLPLGNQTSQFFANVFLDPFDHFVKQELRERYYIRYVDDFVIFAHDKGHLARVRSACRDYLEGWRLRLHPDKSVLLRVRDGVPFLGYRVFPTHRRLPRANVTRMRRRLKRLADAYGEGRVTLAEVRNRWAAWCGHARHARTDGLRLHLLGGVRFEPGQQADSSERAAGAD